MNAAAIASRVATQKRQAAAPDDTVHFLAALGGDGATFTFQTFREARKGARLTRILHGTLAEHADMLADLNARGAGVFVAVNKTDGHGRKAENVTSVRAYFADLDGAPLEPVRAAPLKPHCIVESSPGRWHAYWLVSDAPLASFKAVQQAIAARYGSDPKVCDLPRVMRLPGFLHQKGEPFQSRIVELHDFPRYSHADFVRAFEVAPAADTPPARASAPTRPAHKLAPTIPEGERNSKLLSLAGGLVRAGFIGNVLNKRLQRINAERCRPPLGADEVDGIAACASCYGSSGYLIVPYQLLDSPGWRALTPAAQVIGLAASRRAGASNGPFAVVHSDFAERPGFHNRGVFYRHRAELVRAGFLRVEQAGRLTQQGVTPDLYTIPPTALQGSLGAESGPSETPRKQVRKVRKVDLALGAKNAPVVKSTDSSCCALAADAPPQRGIAMQNTQSRAALFVLADYRPQRIPSVRGWYALPAEGVARVTHNLPRRIRKR